MSRESMRRLVERAGENFTFTTFSEGVADDYGDVGYTADATPPVVRGLRIDAGNRRVRAATGEERLVDVAVLLPSPVEDVDGNPVTIPNTSADRAPTLTDASGRIYKVAGVGTEGDPVTGHIRLMCLRQAP